MARCLILARAISEELPVMSNTPALPEPVGYLCRHVSSVRDALKYEPNMDDGYLWRYTHGTKDLEHFESMGHLEVQRVYSAASLAVQAEKHALLEFQRDGASETTERWRLQFVEAVAEANALRAEVEALRAGKI